MLSARRARLCFLFGGGLIFVGLIAINSSPIQAAVTLGIAVILLCVGWTNIYGLHFLCIQFNGHYNARHLPLPTKIAMIIKGRYLFAPPAARDNVVPPAHNAAAGVRAEGHDENGIVIRIDEAEGVPPGGVVRPIEREESKREGDNAPLPGNIVFNACPSGHTLHYLNEMPVSYPGDTYVCDLCRTDKKPPLHHCKECDYDVCSVCLERSVPKHRWCDLGHQLVYHAVEYMMKPPEGVVQTHELDLLDDSDAQDKENEHAVDDEEGAGSNDDVKEPVSPRFRYVSDSSDDDSEDAEAANEDVEDGNSDLKESAKPSDEKGSGGKISEEGAAAAALTEAVPASDNTGDDDDTKDLHEEKGEQGSSPSSADANEGEEVKNSSPAGEMALPPGGIVVPSGDTKIADVKCVVYTCETCKRRDLKFSAGVYHW